MTDIQDNNPEEPPKTKPGDEQRNHLYALLKRYHAIQAEADATTRKLDKLKRWKSGDDEYKKRRAHMAPQIASIELELPELTKSQEIFLSRLDEISILALDMRLIGYDVPRSSGMWYGLGLHKFGDAKDCTDTLSSTEAGNNRKRCRNEVQEPYTSLRDEKTLRQLGEYASSIYASCTAKHKLIKEGHNGATLLDFGADRKSARNNELLPTQLSELKFYDSEDEDLTQEMWSELSRGINAQITKIRDDSRQLKALVKPALQQIPIDVCPSAQKSGANFFFADGGQVTSGGRPVSVPLKYVVAEQFADRANGAEARTENTNAHAPDPGAFWHADDW